jgi:hypothetical protein
MAFMLLAGTITGTILLIAGAPLWAYYIAPIAAIPIVVVGLRRLGHPAQSSKGRAQLPKDESSESFLSYAQLLDLHSRPLTVEDDLPRDPYVALSSMAPPSESFTYVVNHPNHVEVFRAQALRRLGANTALVLGESKKPTVSQERGTPPVRGTRVTVGATPTIGEGTSRLLEQSSWEARPDADEQADAEADEQAESDPQLLHTPA